MGLAELVLRFARLARGNEKWNEPGESRTKETARRMAFLVVYKGHSRKPIGWFIVVYKGHSLIPC